MVGFFFFSFLKDGAIIIKNKQFEDVILMVWEVFLDIQNNMTNQPV